jgi:hypothetical protein
VSQSQISKDVAAVYERWAERDAKARTVAKGRLLNEIQLNKRIMRDAWEDSLKPREITSQKQIKTPGGIVGDGNDAKTEPDKERHEASLRTEQRDGNVAFMKEVREYIEMEAKILGLYAPEPPEDHPREQIRFIYVNEVKRDDEPDSDDATTPGLPGAGATSAHPHGGQQLSGGATASGIPASPAPARPGVQINVTG